MAQQVMEKCGGDRYPASTNDDVADRIELTEAKNDRLIGHVLGYRVNSLEMTYVGAI